MVADTEAKVKKTKKPTLEAFKALVLSATEQAEKDKVLALWPDVNHDPVASRTRMLNSPTCWSRL